MRAPLSITRRNHYIPKFYQNLFIEKGDGEYIWVYDKDGNAPRPQRSINTGVEVDLYIVPGDNGVPSDFLEQEVFQKLDGGSIGPIFKRWLQPHHRPEQSEIRDVALFLAYMHIRVPRNLDFINQLGVAALKMGLRALANNPSDLERQWRVFKESSGDPSIHQLDDMKAILEKPDEYIKVSMNPKYALAFSIKMTELFHETFVDLEWSLCDAPSGSFFITCDSPVVSFAPLPGGQAQFGGNLVSPALEVSFPVNPEVCVFMSRTKHQERWRAGKVFVHEINRRTAHMAERFIYSHVKSHVVEELTRQAAFTRSIPKIDEVKIRHETRSQGIFPWHKSKKDQ